MPSPASAHDPGPVTVSEELFAPLSADVELCYQTYGDPTDEPLLLVMGLSGPMTWWRPALCEMFVRAGFFVIRYDNRDTGRSSRAHGRVTRSVLVRAFLGLPVRAPYAVADLADDAFGLLDHLGIDSAHLCGVSMGGMIVQTMAVAHPERVHSLTSIMSTTGRRRVGYQDPSLFPQLLRRRPADRTAYVEQTRATWRQIGSPGYPDSAESSAQRAGETFDRGISGSGVLRQMTAILTQPDRTAALRLLDVPVTVIHGLSDRLVHSSGGRATAAAIPGAELVLVSGMGHDLPPALYRTFVTGVRRAAARAVPSP